MLTTNMINVFRALNEDQYNHMTATYYLLAEKLLNDRLHAKTENLERAAKRQRRLQPASDPFSEQIGAFMASSSSKYVLFSIDRTEQTFFHRILDV